jgi:hypothetical protein
MRGFGVHVQKAAHLPGLLVSAVVSGHSWNGQRPDPVMVVRDCERHTADFQLDKLDIAQVRDALLPLIDRESVLCPDGADQGRDGDACWSVINRPSSHPLLARSPRSIWEIWETRNWDVAIPKQASNAMAGKGVLP